MKNLKMFIEAGIEEATLVEGRKSPYLKLKLKQGNTIIYTFSRDLTLIDVMPSLVVMLEGKVNEFEKKYSLEILGMLKKS